MQGAYVRPPVVGSGRGVRGVRKEASEGVVKPQLLICPTVNCRDRINTLARATYRSTLICTYQAQVVAAALERYQVCRIDSCVEYSSANITAAVIQ